MSKTWKHRGTQLDLARQYERPDQIRRFIANAADWGFTHVYLYLEGRIRTPSFPHPDPRSSYDAATMRRLVRFAEKQGVELVPIIPCLGHVEQFIAHKELRHLAEIPPGGPGRFGPSAGTCACPSNPATFKFFTRYYREIAAIFPSKLFHIGMDEAFDVGLCPTCRRRAAREGLDSLVGDFIARVVTFVRDELGRRVVMWDDMLEGCPTALDLLPRDTLLCVWLYDEVFDWPWSRFFNRSRSNLITDYGAKGFQTIAACRDVSFLNVDSLTRHGQSSTQRIGGLVTAWEHSTDFLQQFDPVMAYAASLWKHPRNDPGTLKRQALRSCLGPLSSEIESALLQYYSRRTWPKHDAIRAHLRGLPSLQDHERHLAHAHIRASLKTRAHKPRSATARLRWDVIDQDLEIESLHHEAAALLPRLALDHARGMAMPPAARRQLLKLAQRLRRLAARHRLTWKRVRRAVPVGPLPGRLESFAEELSTFVTNKSPLHNKGLVRLHGFLPDRFGVPKVSVELRRARSSMWEQVHSGSIKTFWDEQPYYEFWIPITLTKGPPKALRITVTGYGGHGFRFVEIETPAGRFTPGQVISARGHVETAGNILIDDKRWTWLGTESVRDAYVTPHVAARRHALTVRLVRSCDSEHDYRRFHRLYLL